MGELQRMANTTLPVFLYTILSSSLMGKELLSLGFTKEMIVLDLVISVHFFIFLFEFRSNSRSHTTRYLRRWLIPHQETSRQGALL